jgi:hypothetical protein
MPNKRSVTVAAAVVVAVVVCLVAVVLVLRGADDHAENAEGPVFTGSPVPLDGVTRFDTGRAQAISAALASGDEQRLGSAIALPDTAPLSPDTVAGFAAMGSVEFDLDTVSYHRDGVATVNARTVQSSRSTWTVYLVLVDSQWKISTTTPGEGR